MEARELGVTGAYVFTPRVYADDRGMFVTTFSAESFAEAVGHELFPVRQMSYSLSHRGVVRGVHYTATPPGCAKLVHCPQGRVLDVVVDLRRGSPTFGQWDSVVLDRDEARSVYLPVGVGHMFVSLADDSVMSYTLSTSYVPANERSISVRDPELDLPLPADVTPVLSERDTVAEKLAEAWEAGHLPEYEVCRQLDSAPQGLAAPVP